MDVVSPTCLRAGQGVNPKEYYTLESLLFLLKNVSLSHPTYVARAGVSRPVGDLHCQHMFTVLSSLDQAQNIQIGRAHV